MPNMTTIAAHRGGAQLWPENSPTAFRNVLPLGPDQIETDVHLASDGEPVIIHDATLDRTAEATGEVAALDWPALSKIRLKGTTADTIPHLDDVLAILAPTPIALRLELKAGVGGRAYPGLCRTVLDHLTRAAFVQRTTITSFAPAYLAEMRALEPSFRFLWLIRREMVDPPTGFADVLAAAKASGVPEIALHASRHRPGQHAAARAAGIRLGLFAVNTDAEIRAALNDGLSAFTTDRPDLALALRRELFPHGAPQA